ncbi:hypothetical protein ACFLXC_03110 [Chloroflexota bacterium]
MGIGPQQWRAYALDIGSGGGTGSGLRLEDQPLRALYGRGQIFASGDHAYAA